MVVSTPPKPFRQEELTSARSTAHLTGSDGRRPFSKAEEEAILLVLREKRVWPAFEGTSLSIGTKGFRSHGWNEKREAEQAEAAAHAAVAAASGAGGQRALHSQRPSKLTKTTSSSSSSVAAAAAAAAVVATTTSPGLVPMQQQPAGSYAPWLTQGSAAAYAFPPWLSLPPAPQLAFTPVTSLAAAPYNNNNPASGSPSPPLANGPLPSVFSDSAALEVSDDALIVHAVLPSLLCICFPDEAPLPPTTESALNCLAAFEARHPGIPAVAVNLAAPSINDVIIAQNAVSVRHVGIVSRLMSGTYRHLVPQTHVVALAKQVIVSTSVEGRESTLPLCAVRLVDGESLVNLIVAVDGAVVVIGALL